MVKLAFDLSFPENPELFAPEDSVVCLSVPPEQTPPIFFFQSRQNRNRTERKSTPRNKKSVQSLQLPLRAHLVNAHPKQNSHPKCRNKSRCFYSRTHILPTLPLHFAESQTRVKGNRRKIKTKKTWGSQNSTASQAKRKQQEKYKERANTYSNRGAQPSNILNCK